MSDTDRGKRSLTDDDIEAIKTALTSEHVCLFDPETRQTLKTITEMYRDGRNAIWKGFIGAVFVGLVYLAAIGFRVGK